MKDIPIGEYFTIGNEVYKCIESNNDSCNYCDFKNYFTLCDQYACMHTEGEDSKEVNFILYDDTTEDDQNV